MTATLLARYLVGDRNAILTLAATRRGWLPGLLLVLGAGLAREYDHEDLLHEPWHALLPLAASLVTATILYGAVRLVSWRRSGVGWPARGGYPAFLALYWGTAPLAWLYALPVERVLPVGEAVGANLWLLAIVSVWRVVLMSRVVQVVWRCHWFEAFHVVGCFAWGVASAAMFLAKLPLITVMGGIELGPGEALLAEVTLGVLFALVFSAPWWLVAIAVIVLGIPRVPGGPWTPDPAFASDARPVAPSTWRLATALVCVGLFLLPFTQPEQRRRHTVETALRAGDVAGAVAAMMRDGPEAYPPHWDPPPRTGFGERAPGLPALVEGLAAADAPAWLRGMFLAKAANLEELAGPGGEVAALDDGALARYVVALERLPEGPQLAVIHLRTLKQHRGRLREDTPQFSEARQALLERLRALAPPVDKDRSADE